MSDTGHTVLLRGCESTHLSLPSRQSIKPTHPDYDRISFEHLKAKCVVTESGCWEIQGVRHQSKGHKHAGYGDFPYRGRNMRAHRASYLMAKGQIPDGHVVAHACDNPPCVNPDHLFTCTESENIFDASRKKRHFHAGQTHCKHGHEFTPENTRLTKVEGRPGLLRRQCMKCDRIRQRMRAGWSREEATSSPLVKPGDQTPRRVIGIKKRHRTDEEKSRG